VEYSKHTIRIKDLGDIQQVLPVISSLQNLVVVNIAGSAEMTPVFFSAENLRAVLADGPESLLVEALPERKYRQLARNTIEAAVHATLALRANLRTAYVNDLDAPVRDYLAQLDRIARLLQCYALQNAQPGLSGHVEEFQNVSGQLAASGIEHGDNVRLMDDLHYRILPVLKKLLKVFRK